MSRLWRLLLIGAGAFVFYRAATALRQEAAPPLPAMKFGDQSRCADLVAALDRNDTLSAQAAFQYVNNVMVELDTLHTKHREQSVLASLSPHGLETTIISGFEQCRTNPSLTLKQAAIEAYNGVRAIGTALGHQTLRR